MKKILSITLLSMIMLSCGKGNSYDPYKIQHPKSQNSFEVDYKSIPTNIKTIHVKMNGTVGKDAIFDTGCSNMLISSLECADLLKTQTISKDDFLGNGYSSYADGSCVENVIINIREVSIVDKNGKEHILHDIPATVVENAAADILIGGAIIDQWATSSYEVDLVNQTIRFK